ncbi:hypothetical protein C4K37_3760 [Pseudomonas chlororaphis subsp. piscium]|nr:hypothetical protein C4K37_3760 [Pseudomonas chlororaphis subsp. piscium]AZC44691.1 hypothetical protein C4K36_3768 [Pseudomonas chlororaphis subsp. piscium]
MIFRGKWHGGCFAPCILQAASLWFGHPIFNQAEVDLSR